VGSPTRTAPNTPTKIAAPYDASVDPDQELGDGSLDPQCFRAARPKTWRWPIFDRSAHPPRSPPDSFNAQPVSSAPATLSPSGSPPRCGSHAYRRTETMRRFLEREFKGVQPLVDTRSK